MDADSNASPRGSVRANAAYAEFLATKRFGSLDAIRCFAILGVVWQHSPGAPRGVLPFADAGASGVGLFFVLSGFLITTLLLREERTHGSISLSNFYMRRMLRIFPLYYAVLGLYTVLVLLREHNAAGRLFIRNLPFYATYTNNWFVDLVMNEDGQRRVIFVFAWTLATEEQFYLVWPPLLRLARRWVAVAVLISVMVIDVGLTLAFGSAEVPANASERLVRIATSPATGICLGVLLALVLDARGAFTRLWPILGNKWSAPLFALVSVSVAMCSVPDTGQWFTGWEIASALAFVGLIGACTVREDHGLSGLLQSRALARVGVISYGMYLLHMISVNLVRAASARMAVASPPLIFVLALGVTYLLAEASYRVFEEPILRLKDRFK